MSSFQEFSKKYKEELKFFFEDELKNKNMPEGLKKSIEYSLINEGKKLRPLIFLAMLKHYGIDFEKYYDIAMSIELIHTYSLVHDDLPSMDNDDYRWGKLTNHKVFGEDMAILSGDAMQTLAYELISSNSIISYEIRIKLIQMLSNYSGVEGMLAGQVYDIKQGDYNVDSDYLMRMHSLKTGKLMTLPLLFAALVANKDEKELSNLEKYGYELGIAYQIKDDILDYYGDFLVTGKKYSDEDMITYLSYYGIETCEKLLENHTESANIIAEKLNNNLLIEFSNMLLKREK